MALQANHYRGHDSTPSPEYIRDMQARTTGALGKTAAADPILAKIIAQTASNKRAAESYLAKVDSLLATVDSIRVALDGDPLAKAEGSLAGLRAQQASIIADQALLKAQAAGEARDILMRGRPEKMSESEWIARRAP
jgi:hypothetical protein